MPFSSSTSHVALVSAARSRSPSPCKRNPVRSLICAIAACVPKCHTVAASVFLPSCSIAAMSYVSYLQCPKSARLGPLPASFPLTYKMNWLSALTFTTKCATGRSSSTTFRNRSTTLSPSATPGAVIHCAVQCFSFASRSLCPKAPLCTKMLDALIPAIATHAGNAPSARRNVPRAQRLCHGNAARHLRVVDLSFPHCRGLLITSSPPHTSPHQKNETIHTAHPPRPSYHGPEIYKTHRPPASQLLAHHPSPPSRARTPPSPHAPPCNSSPR